MKTYNADIRLGSNVGVGNDLMSNPNQVTTTNDGELSKVID